MNKLKIKVENEELLTLVESLQYETESRKEILAYLIDRGMLHGESFEEYQREYREFYVQLNTAKSALEKEIRRVLPEGTEMAAWNLDFSGREITVDAYAAQD